MEEITIDNVGKRFSNLIKELNIISNYCKQNNIKFTINPKDHNPYNQLFNLSCDKEEIFVGTLVLKTEKNLLSE